MQIETEMQIVNRGFVKIISRDRDSDGNQWPARVKDRATSQEFARGAKRIAGDPLSAGGPAVDDCDEQQNVDRNYAVINLEACAHVHARVHAGRPRHIDGVASRRVGRLHRWLGIFVFSGWHRPTFTRLHVPSGCVICMFAVTEENLNRTTPFLPLSPLYNARRAASRTLALLPASRRAVAANSDKPCRKLVGRYLIPVHSPTGVNNVS